MAMYNSLSPRLPMNKNVTSWNLLWCQRAQHFCEQNGSCSLPAVPLNRNILQHWAEAFFNRHRQTGINFSHHIDFYLCQKIHHVLKRSQNNNACLEAAFVVREANCLQGKLLITQHLQKWEHSHIWKHKERRRSPVSNVHARDSPHIFHWITLIKKMSWSKDILNKYLQNHLQNCAVCNFTLFCSLQGKRKNFLIGFCLENGWDNIFWQCDLSGFCSKGNRGLFAYLWLKCLMHCMSR